MGALWLIKDLAEAGREVVIISSYLLEVVNLARRMLVLTHYYIAAELAGIGGAKDQVLKYFFDKIGATI